MKQVIAYYRVSTNDQNLGISAQKEIVRRYCEFNCAEIVSEYEEYESGKKNDRPQLAMALAESAKNNAYRRIVVGLLHQLIIHPAVHVHLANVLMRNTPDLQVYEEVAFQD